MLVEGYLAPEKGLNNAMTRKVLANSKVSGIWVNI